MEEEIEDDEDEEGLKINFRRNWWNNWYVW